MIKHGSYQEYQRYLCKDCDRTFNDKTGTIFAHVKIGLDKLLIAFYSFLRFNTSIRQLDAEIDVSYRSLRRRVEQFARTLDAPSINLVGPVEIDEFYVSAEKKGRERDRESRSRALSKRGRGTYEEDKPPVFTVVDRGSGQRYVVPAKSADEATVQLLLDNHQKESLTVYTDGFRAYDPLDDDENFHREAVIHGGGEYRRWRRAREHVREPPSRQRRVALAASRRLKGQTDSVYQTVPTSATNPPQTRPRGTQRDCSSSSLTHQQCTSQER